MAAIQSGIGPSSRFRLEIDRGDDFCHFARNLSDVWAPSGVPKAQIAALEARGVRVRTERP